MMAEECGDGNISGGGGGGASWLDINLIKQITFPVTVPFLIVVLFCSLPSARIHFDRPGVTARRV